MSASEELPQDARELCLFLVRGLVEQPDAVEVTEEDREGSRVLLIRVADEDRGKVIGRQGRVVRALRSVIRAGGLRSGSPLHIEIDESG
jgi:predicted RNA-binding protein YlqC (UPF0109 family)